jgi:GDP-L-fucose synthase
LSYPKVLVTGAAGLVGTALVAELQSFGYPVAGVTSADGDLRDARATEALVAEAAPDIVVHIAARVHGLMGNIRAQGRAFLDNIRMNTNVIEAARMAGVRKVVGMGSTAVYSDDVPLPMREDTVWWGEPHGSEGGYAHAKRAMIAQLQAYQSEYGLDWAVALSTNLYGPNDKFDEREGHVLPSLVSKFHRATRDGTDVDVWGTGTPTRDFVFSGDAARALRLIMEQATGVVNLASGTSVTIRTAVETLQKVSGFSGDVVWDTSKPDGQHARAYDVSRLTALGWEPQVSLEDGLRATYQWYADNCDDARR